MTKMVLDNQQQSMLTEEEIQDWLADQIAKQLGIDVDEIDIQASFNSYGLDSVQAMNIASLGKQCFGIQLSPLVIWNCPNIKLLSQHLVEEIEASQLEVFEV